MTVNARPNTERNYLQALQKYTDFTGKTPDELITEAEEEIRTGILPRSRSIKRYLISYRKSLEDSGLAPFTVKGLMVGVSSFYHTNDIELPKLGKSADRARVKEEHKDIPTKEDIQAVLKLCDPLERAIVLVGASSGLSAQEIVNIKIKDFKSGQTDTGVTILDLRRWKKGVDFITFLTPEATQAVNDYLEFRGRTEKTTRGKRKAQLDRQRVLSDSGYLFIKRKVPVTFLKTKNEQDRQIPVKGLVDIYHELSTKAQKNTDRGIWNLIRSHNIRKFYNSTLLNAGADLFFTEFTMGHTIDATKSAYFRAKPEELKAIYQKYIPYLTIQKELSVLDSDEFKLIKSMNEKLLREAEKHKEEMSEFDKYKKEVDRIADLIRQGRLVQVHTGEIDDD